MPPLPPGKKTYTSFIHDFLPVFLRSSLNIKKKFIKGATKIMLIYSPLFTI